MQRADDARALERLGVGVLGAVMNGETRETLPSILADEVDDDADVFTTGEQEPHRSVSFDAEEDLDIPDFLKN